MAGEYNTYFGRCGAMVDAVLSDFNDTRQGFAKEEAVLALLNRGLADLSVGNTFITTTTLDTTVDSFVIAIGEEIPTLANLLAVYWTTPKAPLKKLQTLDEFQRSQVCNIYPYLIQQPSRPAAYYYTTGSLFLSPTPTSTESDALTVVYSYLPPAMNGLEDDVLDEDPPYAVITTAVNAPEGLPEPYDYILVEYALWKLFLRDRKSDGAIQHAAIHQQEYVKGKSRLLAMNAPTQMRPYR